MNQPWEKQPDEPMKWYERFERFFRPQPSERRTLRNAWARYREAEGKEPPATHAVQPREWQLMSKEWRWRERAEAYDLEQLRLKRLSDERDAREMLERQREIGRQLQTAGFARVVQLWDEKGVLRSGELSVKDARQYIMDGARLEREARGLPGSTIRTEHSGPSGGPVSLSTFDWASAVGINNRPPPDDEQENIDDEASE